MTSTTIRIAADTDDLFNRSWKLEEHGDVKDAFKCLLAAAQLGHVSSQINLGNYYARGTGVKRNLKEAARWYKEAYRNGASVGALNLAIDRRNEGRTRSAVIWFKKAIAMNDGDASIALAKLYKSRHDARSQRVAVDLLKQALLMNLDRISKDDKEEASALLKEMQETARR